MKYVHKESLKPQGSPCQYMIPLRCFITMNGVVLLELKIILLQPSTRTFSENGKVGNRNQLFTSRNEIGEPIKTDVVLG